MIGNSEQSGQVAEYPEQDTADADGRLVTDQNELHKLDDSYTDDQRFTTGDTRRSGGPVATEFQFPDQQ